MRCAWVLFLCAAACRAAEEGLSPVAPPVEDGEALSSSTTAPSSGMFSGDIRWRLRDARPRSSAFDDAPPALRHAPYFSQRLRLRWRDQLSAGSLAVRPAPGPSLAAGDLRRRGIVKGYVESPGRWIAGDYALSFGQGLLFYDRLGEFVRPSWVQGRGASPDLSASRNENLRGGVAVIRRRAWTATVFASRKPLDLRLSQEGVPVDDPWSLREGGSLEDEEDLAALSTVEEKTAGLRLEGKRGDVRAALTAARALHAPAFQPPFSPFNDGAFFRGRRHDLWGVDAAARRGDWRLAVDAAVSDEEFRRGTAWASTLSHRVPGAEMWMSFHRFEEGYFARHGKGPAFETSDLPASLPANQRGVHWGFRREFPAGDFEGEAAWASFPSAQGNGGNEDPVFPSQARRWRIEGSFRPAPAWELMGRFQERVRDRYDGPAGGVRRQGEETVRRARLESAWTASPRWRFKTRLDARWERTPIAGRRAEGKLVMAEARWSGEGPWAGIARWYAFHSPRAFLTTGVEEVWDGVVAPRLAGGAGNLRGKPGDRYVLAARRRWSEGVKTWIKYDALARGGGADAESRHAWHFQTDIAW